jgi:hypothetical protein
MKTNENLLINNGYGVFCIAMLLKDNRDNDVRWSSALKLYDKFIDSDFNDPEESEFDCINNFMTHLALNGFTYEQLSELI